MSKLLNNATSDGAGEPVKARTNRATISVVGEWAGATVTIQTSPDGERWVTDDNGAFTSNTTVPVFPTPNLYFRAVVSNAGEGTNLDAYYLHEGA